VLAALPGRLRGLPAGLRHKLREAGRREVITEVVVAAPCDVVWDVLTDFASYPSWNPFLPAVTGKASPGERLRAVALPSRGPGMRFRALVTSVGPGAELRWTGVLLAPWLFQGRHYFVLEALPGPRPLTLLRQGEVLAGLLTPLVGAFMVSWMGPGFERMNRALQVRAEGHARGQGAVPGRG
jgi:hypothetical protein